MSNSATSQFKNREEENESKWRELLATNIPGVYTPDVFNPTLYWFNDENLLLRDFGNGVLLELKTLLVDAEGNKITLEQMASNGGTLEVNGFLFPCYRFKNLVQHSMETLDVYEGNETEIREPSITSEHLSYKSLPVPIEPGDYSFISPDFRACKQDMQQLIAYTKLAHAILYSEGFDQIRDVSHSIIGRIVCGGFLLGIKPRDLTKAEEMAPHFHEFMKYLFEHKEQFSRAAGLIYIAANSDNPESELLEKVYDCGQHFNITRENMLETAQRIISELRPPKEKLMAYL